MTQPQSTVQKLQRKIETVQIQHEQEREKWTEKMNRMESKIQEMTITLNMFKDIIQELHPQHNVSVICEKWTDHHELIQFSKEAQRNWQNQIEDMPVHSD